MLLSSSTKKLLLKLKKSPGIKTIEPRTELTQRNPLQCYLQTQERPPPVAVKRLWLLQLRRGRSLTSEPSTSLVIITFCITTRFISPPFAWVRCVQTRMLWLFYFHFICVCLIFVFCLFFCQFYLKQLLTVHSGAFKEQTPGGQVRSEISANVFTCERNSLKCAKKCIQQSFTPMLRWCPDNFASSALYGNFSNVNGSFTKLTELMRLRILSVIWGTLLLKKD